MKILFASGNTHKRDELNKILVEHTLVIPRELGINIDVEETGATFIENAIIKAKALLPYSNGLPVLADDSGICVEALKGEPGIFSARWGNTGDKVLNQIEKNNLLLDKLNGENNRRAYFICSMVLFFNENNFISVQETFKGEIAFKPYGNGGFGYDPIFYIPELGKCAAELTETEKNSISHRGKAGDILWVNYWKSMINTLIKIFLPIVLGYCLIKLKYLQSSMAKDLKVLCYKGSSSCP
jgi:XTP/dITP diphosphohydrolase